MTDAGQVLQFGPRGRGAENEPPAPCDYSEPTDRNND